MRAETPTADQDLDAIIATMRDYGSEFARTYANHAPMVLVAMRRMGANSERLREFFQHYDNTKHLFPFPAVQAQVSPEDWRGAIGDRSREADLRVFFDKEIAQSGIEGTLHRYLDMLAPGVAASALHALMRLAYALMRNDPKEVSAALAYWSAAYLSLPEHSGSASSTDDPGEVLVRVSQISQLRGLKRHELLWHNMREMASQPEFAPVVDWLEIKGTSRSRMASASIALYAGTMDFCALHAVTGMHWMRIVLPYSRTPSILLSHFWQSVAALMGVMDFPSLPAKAELDRWRSLPAPPWTVIKRAAVISNDEHDLSLVFSASEEDDVYHDPLYRLAAARRMGLVDDYTK